MPTRRAFLAAAGAVFARPAWADEAPPPPTGRADPALAPFDRLMTSFLADHAAPGGALAVTRGGRLVYARGFGYADLDRKTPVPPRALFRIASISKPLTAVAVLQLVDAGKVKLDDPVLEYVPQRPHLAAGAEADPRLKDITVRHCLNHTGGWDRDRSGDPIGMPARIARELGTTPPVPAADVIRYALGRRLDFDPGARFAYSNVGYLLLGRVVEAASGMGYERYVKERVLAPVGVTDARLGRALPEHRPAAEVRYYDAKRATGVCLYPPRAGQRVPLPDGAANLEGYEAHGGWIASAADLVRFAAAFDDPAHSPLLSAAAARTMWGCPAGAAGHTAAGNPKPAYYGMGWSVRPLAGHGPNAWHTGLISGTSTLLVRRRDGLCWAALFNTESGKDGKVLADAIDPLVHRAADEVRTWPAGEPLGK
ncbi:MAG TPA: serine hydrolase domain-containing protein [Urbifossiella sp.]|jgi:N-acyl-D-amino-acid deacylase|nr:serine hydrolase domain-containing protein [Urbifossiella sp.]